MYSVRMDIKRVRLTDVQLDVWHLTSENTHYDVRLGSLPNYDFKQRTRIKDRLG